MKLRHWIFVVVSAVAGAWLGMRGRSADSTGPEKRAVEVQLDPRPAVMHATQEIPAWSDFLVPYPTISQLAQLAGEVESLKPSDLRTFLSQSNVGRIGDRGIAALLADRIAGFDETTRRPILAQLEVTGNGVLLGVYGAMFPELSAADLAKLSTAHSARLWGLDGVLRDAFSALAAVDPEQARELAFGVEPPKRAEAVAAVASALAEAGKGVEALDLIAELSPMEFRSLRLPDFHALDSLPPETILSHPGPLLRNLVANALTRQAEADPAVALAWMQSKNSLNSSSASSFAAGLRDVGDAETAAQIGDLVSQVTGPGSYILNLKTMQALCSASARHFPQELMERIRNFPEGKTKDQAIRSSALGLVSQDDNVILSILAGDGDDAQRLTDALIPLMAMQPQRLIGLSQSLPADVQQQVTASLKERWGEEIEPYLE